MLIIFVIISFSGKDLPTIMKHIQDLIMYEDFDENENDPTKFV